MATSFFVLAAPTWKQWVLRTWIYTDVSSSVLCSVCSDVVALCLSLRSLELVNRIVFESRSLMSPSDTAYGDVSSVLQLINHHHRPKSRKMKNRESSRITNENVWRREKEKEAWPGEMNMLYRVSILWLKRERIEDEMWCVYVFFS